MIAITRPLPLYCFAVGVVIPFEFSILSLCRLKAYMLSSIMITAIY